MIWRCALVIALATSTAGCGKIERHYRIDVTINTPQGPRSGQGVVALRAWNLDRTIGPRSPEVEGEAIPVEIAQGRHVFMLVDRPGKGWSVSAPWVDNRDAKTLEEGETVTMEVRSVPGFAVFEDYSDPRTIRQVDFDRPEKSIGRGYSVRSITITRTGDPVSRKTEELLPWVNDEPHQIMNSDPREPGTFENTVWTSAFKRGK